LRHPTWIDGKVTTKFIEEGYPDGFEGVVLTPTEQKELVAATAVAYAIEHVKKQTISGQLGISNPNIAASTDGADKDIFLDEAYSVELDLVVSIPGIRGGNAELQDGVSVVVKGDEWGEDWAVEVDGQLVVLQDVQPQSAARAYMTANVVTSAKDVDDEDADKVFQLLAHRNEGYRVYYQGAMEEVVVRQAVEHQYSHFMLPKEEVDTSKMLLCPMPGKIVSVAVAEGDSVEAGQELCVVEAMKMQNVLRAEKAGVVKIVTCGEGDTLAVDQMIIEFE